MEDRTARRMEALGLLARRLGHDLNNTFGVIQNMVEMTCEQLPADSSMREELRLAEEALQHVQSITNWLAVFHGREARDRVPLDLCRVTAGALDVLRVIVPDDIELVADTHCRPEPWVHASPTQLRRVLFSLALEARERLEGGGILHVTVSSDAQAARLSAGFTPRGAGVEQGRGRPEIEDAVKDLGGQVTSETDTTLEIALPVIPAPEASDKPRGRGEVILIADANSYLRRMIATELTSQGYSVLQAADRAGLFELLEQRRAEIRLLIIDQELPGGVEGLRPDATPTILVARSAERSPDVPSGEGLQLLSKPFQLGELTTLAESLLSGRRDDGP
jgi:CheY-like chemotaxis protein